VRRGVCRCLVETRNSLASDCKCGSAGRNAVVGVDSGARQVRSNEAKPGSDADGLCGAVRCSAVRCGAVRCRLDRWKGCCVCVSTTSPLGPAVVMDGDNCKEEQSSSTGRAGQSRAGQTRAQQAEVRGGGERRDADTRRPCSFARWRCYVRMLPRLLVGRKGDGALPRRGVGRVRGGV
jgi:hypothetical protein